MDGDSDLEVEQNDELQKFLGTSSFGKQSRHVPKDDSVKKQVDATKRVVAQESRDQPATAQASRKAKDIDDDSDDDDDEFELQKKAWADLAVPEEVDDFDFVVAEHYPELVVRCDWQAYAKPVFALMCGCLVLCDRTK